MITSPGEGVVFKVRNKTKKKKENQRFCVLNIQVATFQQLGEKKEIPNREMCPHGDASNCAGPRPPLPIFGRHDHWHGCQRLAAV